VKDLQAFKRAHWSIFYKQSNHDIHVYSTNANQ